MKVKTITLAALVAAIGVSSLQGLRSSAADAAPSAASTGGQVRVMVAAYYGRYFGGVAADPHWMAEHADFVEGEPATVLSFKRAGGRYGMFYTDPLRVIVARKEPYSDLPENAWLHNAQGARIAAPLHGGRDEQNFPNPAAPETQAEFESTTQKAKATGAYDFIFFDDASVDIQGHVYPSTDSPAELRSNEELVDGMKALIAHSALPVVFNGLSNSDKALGRASLSTQLLSVAAGGLAEGCFTNVARFKVGRHWTSDAESLLATTSQGKWAICAPGAQRGMENQARLYAYASWLLTYDKSHSVIRENVRTPSRVLIFPEQSFVPTNPLATAQHIWDLKQSSGAYVREFGQCYFQGRTLGACASVVNPNNETVPVPAGYSKQVVLNGDGTWDGGTLEFQASVPSSLPGGAAAILIR